jgi:hypothetical protein
MSCVLIHIGLLLHITLCHPAASSREKADAVRIAKINDFPFIKSPCFLYFMPPQSIFRAAYSFRRRRKFAAFVGRKFNRRSLKGGQIPRDAEISKNYLLAARRGFVAIEFRRTGTSF